MLFEVTEMAKKTRKTKLPGCIYQKRNRYYWKVKLPGESTVKARPLVPAGGRYATTDQAVAEAVALEVWQKAVFRSDRTAGSRAEIGDDIASLVQAYLEYARGYYLNENKQPGGEVDNVKRALAHLVDYCAILPAEEFGPLKLKEVREAMIKTGLSRGVVNQRIGIIKRMFKWAASEELVPVNTYHGLLTVDGLKRGRSKARETEPVMAIADTHVYAVLPYATATVAAMIELQLLTGMRSGEMVIMRPKDLETSGAIWQYRPATHKTAYRGHRRTVAIGPRCQEIIRAFLKRKLDEYCFSPAEAMEQFRNKNYKQGTKKPGDLGDRYTTRSYANAVKYAIKAAKKAGIKVEDFHPHQLRHTAATRIRKELGLDAARAVLGHRNLKITDDYAELDQALAGKAALKLG
jgi:integrase